MDNGKYGNQRYFQNTVNETNIEKGSTQKKDKIRIDQCHLLNIKNISTKIR